MDLDNVAAVKRENGEQLVCSRKKDRGLMMSFGAEAGGECNGNEMNQQNECIVSAMNGPGGQSASKELNDEDSLNMNHIPIRTFSKHPAEGARVLARAANDAVKQEILPGSGYGTHGGMGVGFDTSGITAKTEKADADLKYDCYSTPLVYVSEAIDNLEMGNINNKPTACFKSSFRKSRSSSSRSNVYVPETAVTETSPAPVEAGATAVNLAKNECFEEQWDPTAEVSCVSFSKTTCQSSLGNERMHDRGALDVSSARDQTSPLKFGSKTNTCARDGANECIKGTPKVINKRRLSRGSQRGVLSNNSSLDGRDEGPCDSAISCMNECYTPRSSRKNFIQLMMNSSPQVRRSMVLKNNCYAKDSARSGGDTEFTLSSVEEDSGSVALDPMEHEWMMYASDGEWERLHQLLLRDPNLVNKKDFVTGFTCLHWSAKMGKEDLLALLMNFAKQNGVLVNVNARSSAGYTPLHLAAIHNHLEVVKLLVGAYDADVEVRDYSGKTASQYLPANAPALLHDIIGGKRDFSSEYCEGEVSRWTLSKVIPTNLIPFALFNHPEEDVCDTDGLFKTKLANKKPSMNIKRLSKIRVKSRIVHSTSFKDQEVKILPQNLRPKSNLFG